ncbi:DUF2280 domain-containing protein [Sinorhizobium arboris]|uniref:DUF2280 domain-containing protein n=1 Tax=Sinorhizobium arboris TaxID=76745 RepID=UPI00040E4251
MAKGKLSEEVKTLIVQSLACFDAPSIVVEAVRKEFGETITRQFNALLSASTFTLANV